MSSRTTIRLDDDLMRQLKERAKREDISLTRLVNETIRNGLDGTPKSSQKRYIEKTYDMGEPLFDLTHTNAVIGALEDEEIIRKMALGK